MVGGVKGGRLPVVSGRGRKERKRKKGQERQEGRREERPADLELLRERVCACSLRPIGEPRVTGTLAVEQWFSVKENNCGGKKKHKVRTGNGTRQSLNRQPRPPVYSGFNGAPDWIKRRRTLNTLLPTLRYKKHASR